MFEDLQAANRDYASAFTLAGLPGRARAGLGVITCMDTRIEPLPILGLAPGDGKILRNAGGRVTEDVLRSMSMAVAFLDVVRVMVLHHTHCALAFGTDDALRAELPEPVRDAAAGWELLAMPDPDAALAADVEAVRSCELIPATVAVEGWRYDVDTGLIHPVVA